MKRYRLSSAALYMEYDIWLSLGGMEAPGTGVRLLDRVRGNPALNEALARWAVEEMKRDDLAVYFGKLTKGVVGETPVRHWSINRPLPKWPKDYDEAPADNEL